MRGSVECMELCVLPRPAQYPAKAAVTSAIGTVWGCEEWGSEEWGSAERGSAERGRGEKMSGTGAG
jgi:hypothetical protein